VIRFMEEEDVGNCVDLGEQFHKSSYWKWLPYEKEKTFDYVMRGLGDKRKLMLVAEDTPSKKIFGFFTAKVEPFYFCDEMCSIEEILFVSPENRGGSTAIKFMKAWEAWSMDVGASLMYFSPTSHGQGDKWDGFMKRLGHHKIGSSYRKALK